MSIQVKIDPSKIEEFKLAIQMVFEIIRINTQYAVNLDCSVTRYEMERLGIYVYDTGRINPYHSDAERIYELLDSFPYTIITS